ncbi:hypothetical protein QBC44DRAFT_3075 [Cladorrhinum sp. PSN332]|nr:hypothetical protein QBC44DRAFT_3075 [Cladorrhinum sp. PSN332]
MIIIVLGIIWWAAPVVAGGDGDDFANNLFSDLGPLLALFGERVAIQYLSHATSWQECVLFACAPLGILTAVISAIRVGGPRWLKAIIGRARETDAAVELELLRLVMLFVILTYSACCSLSDSSTSPDVCELWNGVGMVRIVGTPSIVQLVYGVPSHTPTATTTVHTLKTAKEQGLFTKDKESSICIEDDLIDKEIAGDPIHPEEPPNIVLNVTNGTVRSWELYLAMLLGLTIQFGVLAYDGLLVYLPLPFLDKTAPQYAYTLTVLGTVTMCAGTGICAWIIESRTVEEVWEANCGPNTGTGTRRWIGLPSMVWLQRGKVVADQVFRSFKIKGNSTQKSFLRTSRKNPNTAWTEWWTVTGSTVAMAGFVLQFCGLRSMHWSASIAQLIATALMILIRILIYRRITMMPEAEELHEGHELDQLAKDIHGCSSWRITMPSYANDIKADSKEDFEINPKSRSATASQVLDTRIRLAHLTSWPSKPDSAEMSKRICVVAEEILRLLYQSQGGFVVLKESARDIERFDWKLGVLLNDLHSSPPPKEDSKDQPSCDNEDQKDLIVTFTRSKPDGRWTPWKADANKVDALLSLWLSTFVNPSAGDKMSQRNFWILGRNDSIDKRSVYDWWIDRGDSRVFEFTNLRRSCILERVDVTRVFDLSGCGLAPFSSDSASYFGTVTDGSTITACSQLLIGSFFRCAAMKLFENKKLEGRAIVMPTEKPIDGATQFLITHQGVRKIAEILQQTGLVAVGESYKLVVPVLHEIEMLPDSYDVRTLPESYDEAVVESMADITKTPQPSKMAFSQLRLAHVCKERVKRLTSENRWADAGTLFRQLLEVTAKSPGGQWNQQEEAPFVQQIREVTRESVVEAMRELAAQLVDSSNLTFPDAQTKTRLLSDVICDLTTSTGKDLAGKLFQLLTGGVNPVGSDSFEPENLLALAVRLDDQDAARLVMFFVGIPYTTYSDLISSMTKDERSNHEMMRLLVRNLKSKGWGSIFLEAYERGNETLLDALLSDGFDMTEESILGSSPLVTVCKGADKYPDRDKIIRIFLKYGAKVSATCPLGSTALHYAAKNGHLEMVKILVDEGKASQTATSALGRTPLHLASLNGQKEVADWLLDRWSGGVNARDTEDMTPLHLAAFREESREAVIRILIDRGSDISATNIHGQSPLSLAAFKGQAEAIRLLIQRGASVDSKDNVGRSPLHYAAMQDGKNDLQRAVEAVSILLDEGAAVDAVDNEGWTALHYAYCTEKSETTKIVDLLLAKGSNPLSRDKLGRTANFYLRRRAYIPYWSPALAKVGADTKKNK